MQQNKCMIKFKVSLLFNAKSSYSDALVPYQEETLQHLSYPRTHLHSQFSAKFILYLFFL